MLTEKGKEVTELRFQVQNLQSELDRTKRLLNDALDELEQKNRKLQTTEYNLNSTQ